MVVSGTLFAPKDYHKALRAQLAAAYSHANVETVIYCPNGSNVPEALKTCPSDVAPLFHSKDGTNLFDANAIAYFLGNKQIRGGECEHFVTQWANFTDHILLPSVAAWLYPILGATAYNKQQASKAQQNVNTAMKYMNDFLATRTFFVGEHITQADLTVFTVMRLLFEHLLDEAARKPYPHLVRWFTTIAHQPEVVKVAGAMKMCEKAAVFDPKKQPQKEKPQGKKQEKPQEKKQPPKQQEKPAAKDQEEEPEKKKESKNPFVALPAGTFVYDEFKRIYSNEDIKTVAIPAFWEKFDPKTDSIWYCEYNYPEELSLVFMSRNLINGMFQRLEKMQKFAFAVMNVYGVNKNSTIGGIWVWRGTELAFDLSPDLQTDYESYTWTKLDPSDPETKKKVNDYFARDDTCEGKNVAANCVFK